MSDFASNLPSGSTLDSSKKEQLMEQVKAQIAVANAQEILHVSYDCVTVFFFSLVPLCCRGHKKRGCGLVKSGCADQRMLRQDKG